MDLLSIVHWSAGEAGPFSKVGFSKLSFPESCQKNSLEFHHVKFCELISKNKSIESAGYFLE